jgi:hypothetical protein
MTLTPEERQRIYEEEKARREVHDRPKTEAGRNRGMSWGAAIGGPVLLLIIVFMIGSLTKSSHTPTDTAPSQPPTMTKADVMKDVSTMIGALHDMKSDMAGNSMGLIKAALEVFDDCARLIQKAQAEELTEDESAQVKALRRALSARQRQTFPIMRSSFGPIVSKELWISDLSAVTFGKRYSVIQFVGATFAAHANIANAQEVMHGLLMRLRFKQSRYKWYSEADKYSYYTIASPADDDIAIIDTDGTVTPIPEWTSPPSE